MSVENMKVNDLNTVEGARSLVGTTWSDRSGKVRQITRIDNLRSYGSGCTGDVYWRRPDGVERQRPVWFPNFMRWLVKAKQVS